MTEQVRADEDDWAVNSTLRGARRHHRTAPGEGEKTGACPMGDRSFGPSLLADFVADAVRRRTEADLALVYSICGQELLDGWFGWWSAGRVSHLQLLQAFPWTDGDVVTGEISDAEARRLVAATSALRHGAASSWGIAGQNEPFKGAVRLATSGASLAAHVPLLLGRTPDWVRHDASFKSCVADGLARGSAVRPS